MSNLNRTKVRRESTNTMPSALPLGELVFNSSTDELFVGMGTNSPLSKVSGGDLRKLMESKRDKSIKITKDDMDTSSENTRLGLQNLSEEVHRAMSGNASVNPNIPNEGVTTEKLAPGSITTDKLHNTTYNEVSNMELLKGEARNFAFNQDLTMTLDEMSDMANNDDYFHNLVQVGGYNRVVLNKYYETICGYQNASYLFFHYLLHKDLLKEGVLSLGFKCVSMPNGSSLSIAFKTSSGNFVQIDDKDYVACNYIGDNMYVLNNIRIPANATYVEIRIDGRKGVKDELLQVSQIILNASPVLKLEDNHLKNRVKQLETNIEGSTITEKSISYSKMDNEIERLLENELCHVIGDTFNYALNEDFDKSFHDLSTTPSNGHWLGMFTQRDTVQINQDEKYYLLTTGDAENSYLFFRYLYKNGLGDRRRLSIGMELKEENAENVSYSIRFETTNNDMVTGTSLIYFKRVGNMLLLEDVEIPSGSDRICLRIDGRNATEGTVKIGKIFLQNSSKVVGQDPNFRKRFKELEENKWIENKHLKDSSVSANNLQQSVFTEVSDYSTDYLCSLMDDNCYDVLEKETNNVYTSNSSLEPNQDGSITVDSGNHYSIFIDFGKDLIAQKPFSIKMPIVSMSAEGEIITRYRYSGGYGNKKIPLVHLNGFAIASNIVYPSYANGIEILIDNRNGSTPITFNTPQVITGGLPIISNKLSLSDIQKAIDSPNHIVGGNGTMSLTSMRLNKPSHCTEIRAVNGHVSVDTETKLIMVSNDPTHGYLFYYYNCENGLDPNSPLSVSVDLCQRSKKATLLLRFFDESNAQIGSTIEGKVVDDKWVIEDKEIPSNAKTLTLRFDNRGANAPLIMTNIRMVSASSAESIQVPTPYIDYSEVKVNTNLFPVPNCSNVDWVNYKLSNPTYYVTDQGVKFECLEDTLNARCIGMDLTEGFEEDSALPIKIVISEYSKPTSEANECDFNILFYSKSGEELGRVTSSIYETGSYEVSPIVPKDTTKIRLRFDLAGLNNTYTIQYVSIKGKASYLGEFVTREDLKSLTNNSLISVCYVSPTGSDENEGTINKPKATVNEALSSGASDIRIFGGVYEQTIDLSLCKNKKVSISRHEVTKEVTFVDADRIVCDTETLESGYTKVYKSNISKTFNVNNIWLFQDGVADINTLITDEERHPLQRGYEYRCFDTKIVKCSATTLSEALQEIESSSTYKWYVDNEVLYFSRPSEVNSVNPICCSNGKNLFSNTSGVELNVSGINSKYLVFGINSTVNSTIADCKASNVFSGGAFVYNSALNCKFIRCEATRCFNGSNGDGFNGHCSNSGDIYSKQLTATFIDCWSHDNNDDGYSDHERAESTFIGGLFEYNTKGGVTPSYGAHITCYNVLSRHNHCGFNYVGDTAVDEGGMWGQMICYNCVAENNVHGGDKAGFSVSGKNNTIKLINCKSLNNVTGYKASYTSNTIELIDCSSYGDTKTKGGSGTFIIKNTTVVV